MADSSGNAFKISVVIPTYNRAYTLERAVRSVLKQDYEIEEIIVVDDGSIDETRQLIKKKFCHAIQYHYQDNQGVSCARNFGIRQAKGNWIALLDSDDEWLPNKISIQMNALSKQPEFRLCHGNEIWIRNGKRVNQMNKHKKFGGHIFEKCLPLCVISPSAVLVERKVFDDIGYFDESLPACEDYDYWLRFCVSYPVLYVDNPVLYKYGGHEDQLSRKYWGMDRFRVQALQKILAHDHLTDYQRAKVRDMILYKCSVLAKGASKHGNKQLLATCELIINEVDEVL